MIYTDTSEKFTPNGKVESQAVQPDTLHPPQSDESVADHSRREQSLDVIMDIPVMLSMELGHTRMSIRELLQLTQGSVVKLDRPAGDPLDILVNGCLVARGEVVLVNDRFGVRISDIVSPEERVKRLR
jgi:flagellar motor switch protein FliN/FliY